MYYITKWITLSQLPDLLNKRLTFTRAHMIVIELCSSIVGQFQVAMNEFSSGRIHYIDNSATKAAAAAAQISH